MTAARARAFSGENMSVRENIQFFHRFDPDAYLNILRDERGAMEHPTQPCAYLLDGAPFYGPKQVEDHVSVLGFNYISLSPILIEALANHPELVPDSVLVCWTMEQELLLKTSMGKVRRERFRGRR